MIYYRTSRNASGDLILAFLSEALQLTKIVYRKQYIPLRYNMFYEKLLKKIAKLSLAKISVKTLNFTLAKISTYTVNIINDVLCKD